MNISLRNTPLPPRSVQLQEELGCGGSSCPDAAVRAVGRHHCALPPRPVPQRSACACKARQHYACFFVMLVLMQLKDDIASEQVQSGMKYPMCAWPACLGGMPTPSHLGMGSGFLWH